MLTTNGNNGKKPYTLREIVEIDYPEFWGGASETVRVVGELQNLAIELLPVFKKPLSVDLEQLKTHEELQSFFVNYLKARSIYGLAYKISEIVDSECRNLAMADNCQDSDSVDIAEGELIDIMTLVESLSGSIESIFDDKTGLSKLEEMLDTFRIDTDKPKFDFLVLPNWSYRDIMGSINNRGLLHEDLWNSVLNDIAPKEGSIVALMERPEDNEMVRIY